MSFNDILEYNEKIKKLESSSLRLNKTVQEEINDELINRNIELIYEGRFKFTHFNLYTKDSAAGIEETSRSLESKKYEFLAEVDKDVDFYGLWIPGFGYDTIKYSESPYNWHRLYSYLSAERTIGWFSFDGKVTDYVDQRGSSPFYFDKKYELNDNFKNGIYLNLDGFRFGKLVQYSIYNGAILDIVYNMSYKTSSWKLKSTYSVRKELWSFGVEMNIF